ncbi:hypothetical protein QWY85_10230 [Neolewinella lacunae]|uniref:PsbP C-terminal domain-containing protein n=1 Tax=Neolewinella lacunae TaxID=1517758 RepID=A0A923PN35_9BACT|nr:hypothetical protein [Neolewinella lacunae]MBC6995450.1 hypothetical protein [Neolewinella lacunae]MDN3635038.1 hypothetical protein [Neolewinella lacunae]
MLQRTILFFLLLCCTSLAAQMPMQASAPDQSWEKQQRWEERNDLDGRFRLLAPGQLNHSIDTIETAIGAQAYHTFHLRVPDKDRAENILYVLSYVDYPAGSLHHDSTELVQEFLVNTQEEAAEAVGGEVIYGTEKLVGAAYPGRLWRIDYNGGRASARTLACVASTRYYELKVFSLSAAGLGTAADRFFDSLRLWVPSS